MDLPGRRRAGRDFVVRNLMLRGNSETVTELVAAAATDFRTAALDARAAAGKRIRDDATASAQAAVAAARAKRPARDARDEADDEADDSPDEDARGGDEEEGDDE